MTLAHHSDRKAIRRDIAAVAAARRTEGPEDVDRYVGAQIRTRRLALNMSQEMLALAAGVSFQQIQKYERATNRVSASMLVKIASALDASPGEFFPADDGFRPATDPMIEAINAGAGPLLRRFIGLTPSRRYALAAVADALLAEQEPC